MKIKTFLIIFILISFFIKSHSYGFDCNNKLTKTEKIICEIPDLKDLDENFNLNYKNALNGLSDENKGILKNKIIDLIKVRDLCIKSSQQYSNSNESSKKFPSDHEEFNELNLKLTNENYIQGCISTFYKSISNALQSHRNSDIFKIPTSKEYFSEFNKIKLKPYNFYKIINDELGQYIFSANINYLIYFPNNGKNFIRIDKDSYSYYAGATHGSGYGSYNYITDKGETKQIESTTYNCSIPLKDTIIINKNIYLPEQISFTEFFNNILGIFNESQPYPSSGVYNADCLMRIVNINNNKDAYIIFNDNDFLEDLIFNREKGEEFYSQDLLKCSLEIIKKNQTNPEDLRKILFQPSTIIKELDAEIIINSIKNDCQKIK